MVGSEMNGILSTERITRNVTRYFVVFSVVNLVTLVVFRLVLFTEWVKYA